MQKYIQKIWGWRGGEAYELEGKDGLALVELLAGPFSEGGVNDFFTAEGLRFWAMLLRLVGGGGPGKPLIFLSIYHFL